MIDGATRENALLSARSIAEYECWEVGRNCALIDFGGVRPSEATMVVQDAIVGAGVTAVTRRLLGGALLGGSSGMLDDAANKMDDVVRLGKEGEAAAPVIKNTEHIESLTGTAAYRIPDGLDDAAKLIQEVKNVASLSYTNQLRDFVLYANAKGYRFELFVRPTEDRER